VRRLLYGPPNWLVNKFSSEDRRAFGFWSVVFAIAGTPFLGSQVLWVSLLSVIARVPHFTSETPVEVEEKDKREIKKAAGSSA
jgi:hypothetical protein